MKETKLSNTSWYPNVTNTSLGLSTQNQDVTLLDRDPAFTPS